MKVTKKTILHKKPTKRVVISNCTANELDGLNRITVYGQNFDGVTGCIHTPSYIYFDGDIYVNGAKVGTRQFCGPGEEMSQPFAELDNVPFEIGDAVKVVLHVDKEKDDFYPGDVVTEVTATK